MLRFNARLTLILLVLVHPVAAQDSSRGLTSVDHAAEYEACLKLVEADPEQAFEGAIDWRQRGGGVPAQHCAALSVLALGNVADAAARLDEIAEQPELDNPLRAEASAQAADAWRRAGRPEDALAALGRALELAPDTPRFHVDRGILQLDIGQAWKAIDDFDKALALQSDRPEALQFRATAYRLVEAYDLAETDIVRLLNLEPGDPVALLELGEVRLAQGNTVAAQEAFLLTIENTDADDPLAEAAREKLAKLALGE